MNRCYQVSVLVCTYNPIWDKLKKTIDSCIAQKDVDVKIVITDDGSENNMFGEIRSYLQKRGVNNYVLVPGVENQGTVKNIIKGLAECDTDYVKMISPGDYFCTENVLSIWLSKLVESGKKWSFCNSVYYHNIGEQIHYIREKAHPCMVSPYIKQDEETCRWNYIVLGDVVLGAAVISETRLAASYLQRIDGKVKYAEDNIWRLMMFDGIVPLYCDRNMIMYEHGTGISTSGKTIWSDRLRKDWDSTTALFVKDSEAVSDFQSKLIKNVNNVKGVFPKIKRLFCQKGRMKYYFMKKLYPRMTEVDKEKICR